MEKCEDDDDDDEEAKLDEFKRPLASFNASSSVLSICMSKHSLLFVTLLLVDFLLDDRLLFLTFDSSSSFV